MTLLDNILLNLKEIDKKKKTLQIDLAQHILKKSAGSRFFVLHYSYFKNNPHH